VGDGNQVLDGTQIYYVPGYDSEAAVCDKIELLIPATFGNFNQAQKMAGLDSARPTPSSCKQPWVDADRNRL
jgi:hypothetical protein